MEKKKTAPIKKKAQVKIIKYKREDNITESEEEIEDIFEDNYEGKKDKSDEYEEKGCEFMNEADCEEEFDSDGLDYGEEENKHFKEDDEK